MSVPSSAREIVAADLKHFDKEARALVLEIVAAGWLGRMSGNNHVILYAPDGESTASIAPSTTRNRGGRNARAGFDRWLRAQMPSDASEKVELEQKLDDKVEKLAKGPVHFRCPTCKKTFKNARALGIHKSIHARNRETCPKCGKEVAYLDTHLRRAHQVDVHLTLEGVISVFEEVERLRIENAELRQALGRK